ncbi:Polr3e [Scenedesmus sp. PABB004]|nr:Polr3e [Scenedesmus sp. PABB004]
MAARHTRIGALASQPVDSDDDEVVAELDVVVSNELAEHAMQLVMLQQPLRPTWRPYETEHPDAAARFKPQARRLELSLPLDTSADTYGVPPDGARAITALDLRSTPVEPCEGAAHAVGVVRDGRLVLVPLDYALQLRPDMASMAADPARRREGEASEDDEGGDGGLTAVEVTVKRRETERQQAARLKSFSHLQQEEQAEAWVPLQLHAPDSETADALWQTVLSAPDDGPAAAAAAAAANGGAGSSAAAAVGGGGGARAMPAPLSRTAYLRAFVPTLNGAAVLAAGDAADDDGDALFAGGGPGAGAGALPGHHGDAVSPDMAAAVEAAVKSLVERHPVVSMANVRQWLQQQAATAPLARAAAQLSDPVLDGLLVSTGHVEAMQRAYVATTGTHPPAEPMRQVRARAGAPTAAPAAARWQRRARPSPRRVGARCRRRRAQVVLELLRVQTTVRKGDVVRAAAAAGLEAVEAHYQRVMRELCTNIGNHWQLRSSADM